MEANNTILKSARIVAIILLAVNAVGAFYGSWSLMLDPTGVMLGLPPEWLNRLPFDDYFIPGLVLFIINGMFSVFVAAVTILKRNKFENFLIAQGLLLIIWIVIQMIIVQATEFLHVAMTCIGMTLLALGLILIINNPGHSLASSGR